MAPDSMQVQLCSVQPSPQHQQQCEPGIAEVCSSYWLCRLTADAKGSHAADAAHAVGRLTVDALAATLTTVHSFHKACVQMHQHM